MPHPFADIGTTILQELGARHSITVRRFGGGAWDSTGRFSGSNSYDTPTDAIVQPSTPREIEKLPGNERTKEAITLYTRNALLTSKTNPQGKADQVAWDGRLWEVQIVGDWSTQAQYARAVATRVGV